MTLIAQIGIAGSVLGMLAGLIMGHHWGKKDGSR